MKRRQKQLLKSRKFPKSAIYILSLLLFVAVWWLLSVTAFSKNGVLPTPWKTLGRFFEELGKPKLWRGVYSTLSASLISFAVAFVFGLALAVAAHFCPPLKSFLEPLITIVRSMPTLGVTLILFIFFSGRTSAIVIASLVSLPVVYQNMLAALGGMDKGLLEMARVFNVKRKDRFFSVVLPQISEYIFSALIAGFGLNIKVIVASEIVAVPRSALGSYINGAYISGDFFMMFVWVFAVIVLSFICEGIIKLVRLFCLPHKYSARRKVALFFGKIKNTLRRGKVQ